MGRGHSLAHGALQQLHLCPHSAAAAAHHLPVSQGWSRVNEWTLVSTPGSRRRSYASGNSYCTILCPLPRARVNKSSLSRLPQSLPLRFTPWRWTGLCSPSLRHILPLWASASSCVKWRALNRDQGSASCVLCRHFNLFGFTLMWFGILLGKVCLSGLTEALPLSVTYSTPVIPFHSVPGLGRC